MDNPERRLQLRDAQATESDARALAWGLQEASENLFSTLFGRKAESILAAVALVPEQGMSLEHTSFAELDGSIVGVLHGMPADQSAVPDKVWNDTAGWRMIRAGSIMLLGRQLFSALDRHEPGEWYLQAIAVSPQARGHGVGTQLFERAIAHARATGSQRLTLDVDVKNVRAQKLYERMGLKTDYSTKPARLLDGAAVSRMSMPI
ncbi:MAG: GNAT family N-acetyltransferase [Candidatus Nanopelagicales bacterium]